MIYTLLYLENWSSHVLYMQVLEDLIKYPERNNIFKNVWAKKTISQYDMPSASLYKEFFSLNSLPDFKPLMQYCGYFTGCEIDKLANAISVVLPKLLAKVVHQKSSHSRTIEL